MNQQQADQIVKASIAKHNISNKNLLLFVGVAAGLIILFSFIAGAPVAANTEPPEEVRLAEQSYQETLKSHNTAKEMKAQAIILEMETGAANCFAWKTLAYAKYNAGMEISTPIQDVEHTLCLSSDFQ